MLRYIFIRSRRSIMPSLSILLLAFAIAFSICTLQSRGEKEQQHYVESLPLIPVTMRVTNLSATKDTSLNIPVWAYEQFLNPENPISELVEQVKVKGAYEQCTAAGFSGEETISEWKTVLYGLNCVEAESKLTSGKNTGIIWRDGFDESIFTDSQYVCLIPEQYGKAEEIQLIAVRPLEGYNINDPNAITKIEYSVTLTVAGTYSGSEEYDIYCPWTVFEEVYRGIGKEPVAMSLSAKLIYNADLPVLREQTALWFAEPNPLGQKTPWDYWDYTYFPLALDIDESLLIKADTTMRTSLIVNQISAYLLFVLAAGAGLLVAYLNVRSRKREIMLLRTLGAGTIQLYLIFALGQMICFIGGILFGGAAFHWHPIYQLEIVIAAYFGGVTMALLVFLRKNLMTGLKEE